MAKLIRNVPVDGQWYGPSHGRTEVGDGPNQVPAEVAARITNPAAWDEPPDVAPPGDGDGAPVEGSTDPVDTTGVPTAAPIDLATASRDELVAFIEAHPDGQLDKRLSDENLRAAAAALPPVTTEA